MTNAVKKSGRRRIGNVGEAVGECDFEQLGSEPASGEVPTGEPQRSGVAARLQERDPPALRTGPREVKRERKVQMRLHPDTIRVIDFHDRFEEGLTEATCADLIASFKVHGQQEPVNVRRAPEGSGYEWELYAGRRRLWTAAFLGIEVLAEEGTPSDKEAAIRMHQENSDRSDLSDFEQALSYRRLLGEVPGREGVCRAVFDSQQELCEALRVEKSRLSKLRLAGELVDYPELMAKIGTRTTIPWTKAHEVMRLVKDKQHGGKALAAMKETARKIRRPGDGRKVVSAYLRAGQDALREHTPSEIRKVNVTDRDDRLVIAVTVEGKKAQLALAETAHDVPLGELRELFERSLESVFGAEKTRALLGEV